MLQQIIAFKLSGLNLSSNEVTVLLLNNQLAILGTVRRENKLLPPVSYCITPNFAVGNVFACTQRGLIHLPSELGKL